MPLAVCAEKQTKNTTSAAVTVTGALAVAAETVHCGARDPASVQEEVAELVNGGGELGGRERLAMPLWCLCALLR